MATQLDEKKISFNNAVLNDKYQLQATTPYTWVLRWANEQEYSLKINESCVGQKLYSV